VLRRTGRDRTKATARTPPRLSHAQNATEAEKLARLAAKGAVREASARENDAVRGPLIAI